MSYLVRVIGFIISVIMVSGCGENNIPGEHKVEHPVVQGAVVKKLTPVEVTEFHESSGTVRSVNTSVIAAKVMGEISDIKVNVSDSVRKGDLLLVIKSPDIDARIRAASEALGEAEKALDMAHEQKTLMEKTFSRFKELYTEKAVSEQEFDEIRTKRDVAILEYELSQNSLKKAQAALEEAEAFSDYITIRSPVNGIIADKHIDIGSMAAPGMPLIIIEENTYRIETTVDEGMFALMKVGMPVKIFIDSLGLEKQGTVGEIVHQIDPATRSFTVKIDIKESSKLMRGGFYSRVRFPVGKKTTLYIDEQALITRGELKGVYTVDDEGLITLRIIKIGKKEDGLYEVLSGLNPGERIIVEGVEHAVDGGSIR
ncbi:MAG: efflux RND transporter periplasmic adaptor subunit [Nitrospiraceae bacterium]|nr:MAG: efflux RND transporter periplasmic adaptor subunit [Nitrospiraceae bacterium]